MPPDHLTFQLDHDVCERVDGTPDDVLAPVPAHKCLPKWYRMLKATHDGGGLGTSTVKMCRPFGDALKMGFVVPYPEDISVTVSEGSLSSDSDLVTIYGDGMATSLAPSNANSEFRLPELKLRLPWRIRTPPGYRALVTHPLNRSAHSIKPYSLLVDTTGGARPISIPARIDGARASVERGDPMVQIIVFHENALLTDVETRCFSDYPDVLETRKRHKRINESRKDWYRTNWWQKKPTSTVTAGDPPDVDTRTSFPGGVMQFYAHEEDFGVSHAPVSAEDLVPEGYADVADTLGGGSEEERIQEQMLAATCLGCVTRTTGRTKIVQTDGEVEIHSEYPEETLTKMRDVKLGTKYDGTNVRVVSFTEQWVARAPEGYSVLFTEPMNHCQTDFRAYSGYSDVDKYYTTANNPGMLSIADDETVVISDGMPVGQLIPLHREGQLTDAVVSREESDG